MEQDSPEQLGGGDPQDDPNVLLAKFHSVDVRDMGSLLAAADS